MVPAAFVALDASAAEPATASSIAGALPAPDAGPPAPARRTRRRARRRADARRGLAERARLRAGRHPRQLLRPRRRLHQGAPGGDPPAAAGLRARPVGSLRPLRVRRRRRPDRAGRVARRAGAGDRRGAA